MWSDGAKGSGSGVEAYRPSTGDSSATAVLMAQASAGTPKRATTRS